MRQHFDLLDRDKTREAPTQRREKDGTRKTETQRSRPKPFDPTACSVCPPRSNATLPQQKAATSLGGIGCVNCLLLPRPWLALCSPPVLPTPKRSASWPFWPMTP